MKPIKPLPADPRVGTDDELLARLSELSQANLADNDDAPRVLRERSDTMYQITEELKLRRSRRR